ncbi:PucR family transcriptional regulator [Paractinoplanes atraurantiacus]|uniref:PucR C-terminal helix-turn-helix domain-containing protein n=1 Tax=Paractinoplanes atraurantiacus TaxID=1036182 RepID=A0A285HN46_9ACTN|nr:PucR family transcriptional regulator [Actinoplanes atraurantiacus]SNY37023.1 PucR C-terminal helix-turn-helix domain-containing protein [Actinoplanes atraurantiacus]
MSDALPDVRAFRLSPEVVAPLKMRLPDVALRTIDAIMTEVPAYAVPFAGDLGPKIERAVRAALGTFLELVSRADGPEPQSPLGPALEGAYALGRGEARNGRSLDALLGAYRVGARVSWHELAAISVSSGQPAATIAHFAELVFAYIDELSAASVAGHADQLASSGRARIRDLEQLAQALLGGEPEHVVRAAAERADWSPPRTLTAVLVPEHAARTVVDLLDPRTLQLSEVLLVPDVDGGSRAAVLGLLRGQRAVVGPARPWLQAKASYDRALRTADLIEPAAARTVVDTDDHLAELVLTADPQALADLRARVLAPLTPGADPKLVETLRSWLRHQGRREDVAAELFIHPQTVRYRMTRLRELYGDRLRDPEWTSALIIALTVI